MVDPAFLRYYSDELAHLRELGQEFAAEFPKIASRLQLSSFDCADPYVERLLEGFAFMSARVRKRLEDSFPRFTESILNVVFPLACSPVPSMAIIKLNPDFSQAGLMKGFDFPLGAIFDCPTLSERRTPCRFRSGMAIKLWPLDITEVQYLTTEVAEFGVPGDAAAAIRVRLDSVSGVPLSSIPLDSLRFFINLADDRATSLLEHLFANRRDIFVRSGDDGHFAVVPGAKVEPVGFGAEDELLPDTRRTYRGFSTLVEYFAFPSRFKFFAVSGLAAAMRQTTGGSLDLVITLDKRVAEFAKILERGSLQLYCVPVANVFPKSCDRILFGKSYEYHVVPDRVRPRDYEVYSLISGSAYDADNRELFRHSRFHHITDTASVPVGNYFDIHRRARLLTPGKGQRSSYVGTEVFVSLSGPEIIENLDSVSQLGMDMFCTNRDLSLLLDPRGQPEFSDAAPVSSASFIVRPTPPSPPPMWSQSSWEAIRHFRMAYRPLFGDSQDVEAESFREMLRLYAPPENTFARQQIDGIHQISARPIVRMVGYEGGAPCFARGIEATLTLDEFAFAGLGAFIFGMVLKEFCSHFISINSFVEMVVKTNQRGEIIRWTPQAGIRSAI